MPTHKINADLALTGTLTVGVDDTGHDVKFFGATSSRFLQWDESEDYLLFRDNVKGVFGNGADLKLYHDASNSYIENGTGNLYIMARATDADMSFQCDDGSGGDAEYFRLDGGATTTIFSKPIRVQDSTAIEVGSGADLELSHNGTNSAIVNYVGDLNITNSTDDGNINFACDDGSGGTETYFFLDGGGGGSEPFTVFPDNANLVFGSGHDYRFKHDGSHSYIQNYVGNLNVYNYTDDGDITFYSDDGSGGVTTYFQIDGGSEILQVHKDLYALDNVKLRAGNAGDLYMYHDGTNSYLQNTTGDLYIQNGADDKDVILRSDDGSGGQTAYITLDGSVTTTKFNKQTLYPDSVEAIFGDGSDLKIKHDGTDSLIRNFTGSLIFRQTVDDGDIFFQCDDGSGGTATYLRIDGNNELVQASKDFKVGDNINIFAGTGNDLQIIHDGSDSYIKTGNSSTGNLIIEQNLVDKDIILKSDNGSGGTTAYITLDGSTSKVIVDQTLDIQDLDIGGTATGDGSGLTDLNGSQITSGTVAAARVATLNQNTTGSSGSCTGNAATATLATNVTVTANNSTDETIFPVFVDGATGTQGLETDTGFTYNPSSGTLVASKLTTDQAAIVENAKDGAALMTLTGAGAGTEANVGLKLLGTVHGNPIKIKMTAENDSGTATGAGILSYEPDDDAFNIGQSTTHNRMGISIGNTVTIGSSDVIYQEDVTIKSRVINMTANANHFEFNGDIMKVGNDTTTRGKLYNYKNGTWTLADKDAEADADGLLAIAVGTNSTTHGMLLRGTMTLDYDPGGAGDVLYVGDSGVIQNSAPSGSGDIVRIVGYLLGGAHGNIFFDPDKTFVEVA